MSKNISNGTGYAAFKMFFGLYSKFFVVISYRLGFINTKPRYVTGEAGLVYDIMVFCIKNETFKETAIFGQFVAIFARFWSVFEAFLAANYIILQLNSTKTQQNNVLSLKPIKLHIIHLI